MRLKITIPRDPKHKDGVIAVGWMNSDEMISAGDDQQILKWDLINYEAHLLLQMPKLVNIFKLVRTEKIRKNSIKTYFFSLEFISRYCGVCHSC